jgi:hypothetical protein
MKKEQTECSKTLEFTLQMPVNYPEESIWHSEHGKSFKSRILSTICNHISLWVIAAFTTILLKVVSDNPSMQWDAQIYCNIITGQYWIQSSVVDSCTLRRLQFSSISVTAPSSCHQIQLVSEMLVHVNRCAHLSARIDYWVSSPWNLQGKYRYN